MPFRKNHLSIVFQRLVLVKCSMRPPLPLIFLSIERCLLSLGCQNKINTPLIYQVQDKSTHKFVNLRKPNNSREPNNYRIHHHINLQTQKTSTHKLTTQTTPDTSTHQLTNSSTHKLKKTANPSTCQLTNSQAQNSST